MWFSCVTVLWMRECVQRPRGRWFSDGVLRVCFLSREFAFRERGGFCALSNAAPSPCIRILVSRPSTFHYFLTTLQFSLPSEGKCYIPYWASKWSILESILYGLCQCRPIGLSTRKTRRGRNHVLPTRAPSRCFPPIL